VPRSSWLAGCCGCGLLFSVPRPTASELASYYNPEGDWSRREQSQRRSERERIAKPVWNVISERLDLQDGRGRRVLDIGCGNGKWLNTFSAHGWQTFGLEPSSRAAFARHQEVTAIPEDHSFDLVILNHVLEHLAEPGQMLRAASAALRDGGVLFVSVPNLDAVAIHGDFRYCINGRAHLQAFSADCLRVLLSAAGFTRVGVVDDPRLRPVEKRPSIKLRMVAWRDSRSSAPQVHDPLDAARAALRSIGLTSGAPGNV
jgi:SAM-dependent methyltransferase